LKINHLSALHLQITGTKLLIGLALIMNRGAFKFKKVLTVLGGVYTGEDAVHIATII